MIWQTRRIQNKALDNLTRQGWARIRKNVINTLKKKEKSKSYISSK